jgi:hypothetical protein
MKDEEKVARLAAILGIEGAVQYGAYHGHGERSHKKGYRVARLGIHGGDGRTDADALADLVRGLVRSVDYAPRTEMHGAASLMRSAEAARIRERAACTEAEQYEALAGAREKHSQEIAAQFALYCADAAKGDE